MPKYQYVAIDSAGRRIKGEYSALDEKEVQVHLRSRNLKPQRIHLPIWAREYGSSTTTPPRKDVVSFTRMLSTMVSARVPLNQALATLYRATQSTGLKRTIRTLMAGVESGDPLSRAARGMPAVFDDIYVNMLGAGEASGHLDTMLNRLADTLERTEAMRSKVRGAMMYPAFISIAGVGAVIALIVFVIPQFVGVFAGSGVALPLPTRFLMGTSDTLRDYWYLFAAGLGGIIYGIKQMLKRPKIAFARDKALLRAPILGNLVLKSGVSRLCRTLSTLTLSGVPLMDALRLVGGTTGSLVIQEALADARARILRGDRIAAALEAQEIFPPMFLSMVSVGDQTGEMDEMMTKAAEYYEMEVNAALEGSVKLIEPTMLVLFGAVIALILAAIYLPMFDMINAVGNDAGSGGV